MGDLVKETPFSEVNSTLEVLDNLGVSRDDFKRIRTEKTLAQKIVDVIRDRSIVWFAITVDYRQSLEKMVKSGHYDWTNNDINSKNFPIQKGETVEIETQLVHFDKNMGSDAVIAELDKMGLRPATIAELLVFGAKYPDKQKEFPIVALGSVSMVHGDRGVACLDFSDGERDLSLHWFGIDWNAFYRFLAVRK